MSAQQTLLPVIRLSCLKAASRSNQPGLTQPYPTVLAHKTIRNDFNRLNPAPIRDAGTSQRSGLYKRSNFLKMSDFPKRPGFPKRTNFPQALADLSLPIDCLGLLTGYLGLVYPQAKANPAPIHHIGLPWKSCHSKGHPARPECFYCASLTPGFLYLGLPCSWLGLAPELVFPGMVLLQDSLSPGLAFHLGSFLTWAGFGNLLGHDSFT